MESKHSRIERAKKEQARFTRFKKERKEREFLKQSCPKCEISYGCASQLFIDTEMIYYCNACKDYFNIKDERLVSDTSPDGLIKHYRENGLFI